MSETTVVVEPDVVTEIAVTVEPAVVTEIAVVVEPAVVTEVGVVVEAPVITEVAVEVTEGVGPAGPAGADGPPGGPGQPGPPGPMGGTYTHVQQDALATWTVTHNLGIARHPTIVLDSAPNELAFASVEVIDLNTLSIEFDSPVTGTAYL